MCLQVEDALKLPYFSHLHDPNDEPKADRLFSWNFEETEMWYTVIWYLLIFDLISISCVDIEIVPCTYMSLGQHTSVLRAVGLQLWRVKTAILGRVTRDAPWGKRYRGQFIIRKWRRSCAAWFATPACFWSRAPVVLGWPGWVNELKSTDEPARTDNLDHLSSRIGFNLTTLHGQIQRGGSSQEAYIGCPCRWRCSLWGLRRWSQIALKFPRDQEIDAQMASAKPAALQNCFTAKSWDQEWSWRWGANGLVVLSVELNPGCASV